MLEFRIFQTSSCDGRWCAVFMQCRPVPSFVCEMRILGLTLDTKLTYERHIRTILSSAAQKIGILRRAWSIYRDENIVSRCYWSLILPILEYCSPVWNSSADGHLALLNHIVNRVTRLSNGLVQCSLEHRRNVAALCMLYKVRANTAHPLNGRLPQQYVPPRALRRQARTHAHQLSPVFCRSVQYQRTFVPRISELWNSLGQDVLFEEGLQKFKTTVNRYLLQV